MGRKEAPTTIQESVDGICARVSAFVLATEEVMLISCRLTRLRGKSLRGNSCFMKMAHGCRGRRVW